MERVTENNSVGDPWVEFKLRNNIAELESKLKEEKERCALLESESAFMRFAARQEVDEYARACDSLREDVARLSEDYSVLRERGLKDRDRIKCLLKAAEEREREIQSKLSENKDEVLKWKRKFGKVEADTLKLLDENSRLVRAERRRHRVLEEKCSVLECARRKAQDEARRWMEKCGVLECEMMKARAEAQQWKEKNAYKEKEFAERLAAMQMEKKDLERAKREMEDEVREWNKKFMVLIEKERKERDLREKYVQLEIEIGSLKCTKGMTPVEIQEWKKYRDLESRVSRLVQENSHLDEKQKAFDNAKGKSKSHLKETKSNSVGYGDSDCSDSEKDNIPLIQMKRLTEASAGANSN